MILKQMYSGGGLFVLTISSNTALPNIPTLAAAAGWNGSSFLKVNITASLVNRIDILSSWAFPSGLEIEISSGTRVGGNLSLKNALTTAVPVSIRNNGVISGAGGDGGSGGNAFFAYGANSPVFVDGGTAGTGQGFENTGSFILLPPIAGTAGGYAVWGGSVFGGETPPWAQGGSGSEGGIWGSSGLTGGFGSYGGTYSNAGAGSAGAGGTPGNSIVGNSLITWLATGSRLGPIS